MDEIAEIKSRFMPGPKPIRLETTEDGYHVQIEVTPDGDLLVSHLRCDLEDGHPVWVVLASSTLPYQASLMALLWIDLATDVLYERRHAFDPIALGM